jgi:hypothetical protein
LYESRHLLALQHRPPDLTPRSPTIIRSALESRAKEKKATGGKAYGYRDGKVDKGEAFIVREIFGKFADGASCRTIAAELNGRRIASPGSTWNRTERRVQGWMGSGVRVILRNERYRGVVLAGSRHSRPAGLGRVRKLSVVDTKASLMRRSASTSA